MTLSIVSPSICHEVMVLDAMILILLVLSCKPVFSLSSFTFIKRLLSSSSLSAIRVVTSAYLRLLIFLLAILIPVLGIRTSTDLWRHNSKQQGGELKGSDKVIPCCDQYWEKFTWSVTYPEEDLK